MGIVVFMKVVDAGPEPMYSTNPPYRATPLAARYAAPLLQTLYETHEK